MDMTAKECVDSFDIALERNVDKFDALQSRNLLHCDVISRGGAGCSITDFAGIGFRVSKKFLESFPRRVAADDHAKNVTGNADDIGKVCNWIIRGLPQEGRAEDA